MSDYIVTFDGSFEGFLCVVHAYYYDGIVPVEITAGDEYQQALDAEEYYVSTDYHIASQVRSGIQKRISHQASDYLALAFCAEDGSRFMDMFRYTVFGFKIGSSVDNHLQRDFVLNVHKLARYVGREAHLLTGFSRFSETTSGVFYCEISPVNDVLLMLAEHFCDRMMNQAWVIHDTKRNIAALYNGEYYEIANVPKRERIDFVDKESHIQDLWRTFFKAVVNKDRVNRKLQRNLLPLHFRKNMTEFTAMQDEPFLPLLSPNMSEALPPQ